MGEPPVLLFKLPLPERQSMAAWMQEPCTESGCESVIHIRRWGDQRTRLVVQHGENPEHVVLIDEPCDNDTHDFDAAICEIQAWLVRVHGAQLMGDEL